MLRTTTSKMADALFGSPIKLTKSPKRKIKDSSKSSSKKSKDGVEKIKHEIKKAKKSSAHPALAERPYLKFDDYPDFQPNLTPEQVFRLGSFGGTYWRPIKSAVTGKKYENVHKKYPEEWFKGIPEHHLTRSWNNYDKNINRFGEKVGTTLEEWEEANWINESHPYGWMHWYCDFYNGERCKDDKRQISRWMKTGGPNSRFRKRLINMLLDKRAAYNDRTVSPKIRQTLQHWGVEITQEDLDRVREERGE